MSTATRLLDRLDEARLRERLRRLEEERAALIALIRARRARDRAARRASSAGKEGPNDAA
jgi:hypothetical protein